jgi:ATP-dependent DNA helicase RecQ
MDRAVPPDDAPHFSKTLPVDLDAYRHSLTHTFGFPDFRSGQADVLRALTDSDVLAVMPTGSGKSLCYVLPALEVGGTVVVSPLIALMQDQVESLVAAGVAATFINSNLDRAEQNRRFVDFIQGRYALLYVAPERFAVRSFSEGLRRAGVRLLAIDEAHCISEWGHNFRPDYLQLGAIRDSLGRPRTLALTATADPTVRDDIVRRLHLGDDCARIVGSVDRPNLHFAVEDLGNVAQRTRWLIDFLRAKDGASGIVYARTRRQVDELAEALRNARIKARPYHAGLGREERSDTQRRFMLGDLPVIVATNAFGMGIDKPDIRFVVHFNLPGRIEAYYQEAGRAGRDGDPAACVLLYAPRDRNSQQRFIDLAHPDDATVRETWVRWSQMAGAEGRLPFGVADDDPDRFANVVAALRASGLMHPVELALTSGDPDAPIDTSSVHQHLEHAEGRLRDMAEYAETRECRRAVILRYFGEDPPDRCDACDNCLNASAPDYPPDLYDEIVAFRDEIANRTGRETTRVFEMRTARELATARPQDDDELREVWGIGETRAQWLGADLLRLVCDWEAAHPDAPPRSVPEHVASAGRGSASKTDAGPDVSANDPLYQALRSWRLDRSLADGVPAFTLFSDRTLRELVVQKPGSRDALLEIWGLGETRVDRFGEDVLAVIAGG